mmetsp:Transcript_15052/g.31647  ORF Transcript_15052/g.31647 Transcript_15052/m.31647 type:complete len:135 (+) Transcript_15052:153-557(+)|eukprot:CAMPEP_0171327664 /NCGR_PEP_ID=MMETSP0878-20121228/165_1 /TAXON_ID=67004 /ORGANISM="Thalassiosira weissflogii, Strain CCMP1336" /LENGTH=134 /DNA_ID=CAMNT_0011827451 /DNA_START=116 /DNA_END=520 /DNA_ORIENTATION=+
MPYSEFSHVIDWVEAMEQCGDDEDFLRELLSDLRGEIDAQIVRMDEVLQAGINDQSFLLIMRASHVIKGASANLMCQELREAATNLEQAAAAANHIAADDAAALESASQNVKDKYNDLKKGVENFHKFLDVADI